MLRGAIFIAHDIILMAPDSNKTQHSVKYKSYKINGSMLSAEYYKRVHEAEDNFKNQKYAAQELEIFLISKPNK